LYASAAPGIGATSAGHFAREGFDLIWAARDVSKLAQSAEKPRKDTSRNRFIFSIDVSKMFVFYIAAAL
jgi:short-subunit dehydrogenase